MGSRSPSDVPQTRNEDPGLGAGRGSDARRRAPTDRVVMSACATTHSGDRLRLDTVWQGSARCGRARSGSARQSWPGVDLMVEYGAAGNKLGSLTRLGPAGQSLARRGLAWRSAARQARTSRLTTPVNTPGVV